MPGPNQAKFCMGDEAIIIGVVDREDPTAQASREWEFLDLQCVIVSVARQESPARERPIGPGRREEEWEEPAQHCGDESEYDSEEYSLDKGQRDAGLDTLGVPSSRVWVDLFASGENAQEGSSAQKRTRPMPKTGRICPQAKGVTSLGSGPTPSLGILPG